jgi:Ca-activated chloride channel homolog
MRFAQPLALLLLLLIPPLVMLARRRARPQAIGFPSTGDLAPLPRSLMVRLHRALPWLRALALALAVVAIARPQWGVEAVQVQREGIAIAMVIDISSSMSAIDLTIGDQPSDRLEAVKAVFRDFVAGSDGVDGREGDSIGMVTFARFADTISPPTHDHAALLALLDQVEIVAVPSEDGTAIGDGIVRGIEMLRTAESAAKVMILLTDGSNNAGEIEPLAAAQIASSMGVRIYAIGAGTRGTAMVPVPAAGGGVTYLPTQVSIDEETLDQIAALTGGGYFRATDADTLRGIYAEIDRLEKTRTVALTYQRYVEVFPLALALALALLVLEIGLVSTRLRTVP